MNIKRLRKAIREELALKYLLEAEEEKEKDADYDLADTGAKVTPKMKKAIEADGLAFMRFDDAVDKGGNPKEQAGMLAKFALDYVDYDPDDPDDVQRAEAEAVKILKLAATRGVDQLTPEPKQEDKEEPAGEGDAASGDSFKQGMAQEGLSKKKMLQIIREEVAQYYMTKFLK